jgi:hypothetical protein
MNNSTIDLYQKQFVEIKFERTGLFKALKEQYGCNEALYPGSSLHITPSLFFPHVVYVDQSSSAIKFFSDMEAIQAYVNRKKHYKRKAFIRFIAQDYTIPLALPQDEFDLLISLYAGGVSKACNKYLKQGGILLTNNHQNDIDEIVKDTGFQLRSIIKCRNGKYYLTDKEVDKFVTATRNGLKARKYLKSTSQGFAYREEIDVYFVFEKSSGTPM